MAVYGNVNVKYSYCKSVAQLKSAADYIWGQRKEQIRDGVVKTSTELYTALGCNRDNFANSIIITRISSIPFWQKSTLTLEEAAEYSGIGIHKLRKLADARNCQFVLWNGNRRLIKRRKFDEFLDDLFSVECKSKFRL